MRKIVLAGLLISALLPITSYAATAEELQAQIADLLARITALQQQLGTSGGAATSAGTSAGTPVPVGVAQCPHVSRVLKRGATGADVTRLQQFLALDPAVYPEAQVSGYYGALTEAAVKRFQCKNKLVCDGTPESTGYGVTGPRTAALMALQCSAGAGASSNVGGFIKVTPISGNAPLNVTIEVTVNTTRSCTGAVYEVDYGDNTPKTVVNVPANNCNEMRQVLAHTYVNGGTYIVTLRSGTQQTSATVTVGGGGGSQTPPGAVDELLATPVSGNAPLTVTFRGTINANGACNANNTYLIDFGDGQTAPLTPSGCVPSLFTATHIYGSSGTFSAKLVRNAGNAVVANLTVTVGGGNAGGGGGTNYGSFFSVSPGSSGDVYSVVAEFEIPSSCTAYQLNWGDGSALVTQSQGTCSNGIVSKDFQHTYANAGTYTVTLKRGSNLSEVHTAGITISD